MRGSLLGEPLPPHVTIIGQRDIGVDAVGIEHLHRIGIGLHAGAGCDSEEPCLGIDGIETAVLAEAHPRNVITDGLHAPSGDRRLEHRQIGLAAGGGEGRRDVAHVTRWSGQLEDEHVLGQPPLITRHGRGDAQRETLLAQEGVAAITGTEGPDLAGLGEMGDVLRVIAGPRNVGPGIAVGIDEWITDRVDSRDEVTPLPDVGQGVRTHTGHDLHVDHDVRRVGEFNTQLCDV